MPPSNSTAGLPLSTAFSVHSGVCELVAACELLKDSVYSTGCAETHEPLGGPLAVRSVRYGACLNALDMRILDSHPYFHSASLVCAGSRAL